MDERPYVPAVIPPDPARDARVAARRAADAARAGRALDRLLAEPLPLVCMCKYAQCTIAHDE